MKNEFAASLKVAMKDVTDEFAESLKALKDSFAASLADGIKGVKDDYNNQVDECNKAIVSLSAVVMTHRRETVGTIERSHENHDRIDQLYRSFLHLIHENFKLEKAISKLKSSQEMNLNPILDRIDKLESSNSHLTAENSKLENELSELKSNQVVTLPVEEPEQPSLPFSQQYVDRLEQLERSLPSAQSIQSPLATPEVLSPPEFPQPAIFSVIDSCLDRLSKLENRARRRSSSTPPKND
ncbi:hypothetical protein HDE_02758 [Halotydeus destructor]|nr:hypothetical protein HDE_02758 [Halotydeus destructor]